MSRSHVKLSPAVLGSAPLAKAVREAIKNALKSNQVVLCGGKTVDTVFNYSLQAAIRDIREHPKGQLFLRFLEYGPPSPDEDWAMTVKANRLSDDETAESIEFIYSHMINRFKGELAELLALSSCLQVMERLVEAGQIPATIRLYWGDTIHEPRGEVNRNADPKNFAKGSDGLWVEISKSRGHTKPRVTIHGVIEVKSYRRSPSRVLQQIDKHLARLSGGLQLENCSFNADEIFLPAGARSGKEFKRPIRILVLPAHWKLPRHFSIQKNTRGRQIIFAENRMPPHNDIIEEIAPQVWQITLAWSHEALSQAAYEMTFWYMAQVGTALYAAKPLPKGWEYMSPEQAGQNAVKMMLYYAMMRPLSTRQQTKAIALYNVYCFGYPLGMDNRDAQGRLDMMWPQDLDKRLAQQNEQTVL